MQYIVNVEVVVQRDNSFLLTRRSLKEEVAPGLLSFPGGKVEGSCACDDVLEETAARELMEETGVKIDNLQYVTSKLFITPTGNAVVDIVFLAQYAGGTADVKDPEELDAVFWVSKEGLLAEPSLPPWARDVFMAAMKLLR